MGQEIMTLHSACDGLPLSAAIIAPETKIKGIVQLSHGMAEHKERYFPFMQYLAAQGFAAIIHDHRGHGASVRKPDDLGYFYDDSARYIVEDLYQVTQYARALFPGCPLCLFGHSMGSLVVRSYLKKYDANIDKLIVCGSPSKNPLTGVALALTAVQKAFHGDRYRSELIQKLAFGSYLKGLADPASQDEREGLASPTSQGEREGLASPTSQGKTLSANAWLSVNEENVRAYDEDPLCGFTFTLNGFRNLFLLLRDVYSPRGWALKNPALPVLFIAGSADPVIAGAEKWRQSQEFLRKLGYRNVRGRLYQGLRHEILNEDSKEQIFADVAAFLTEVEGSEEQEE